MIGPELIVFRESLAHKLLTAMVVDPVEILRPTLIGQGTVVGPLRVLGIVSALSGLMIKLPPIAVSHRHGRLRVYPPAQTMKAARQETREVEVRPWKLGSTAWRLEFQQPTTLAGVNMLSTPSLG